MAITDLSRSTYSGEFGFLIVDPSVGDPGRYDREVMLAAHHWEGSWVSMQDMKKGPPPDNWKISVHFSQSCFCSGRPQSVLVSSFADEGGRDIRRVPTSHVTERPSGERTMRRQVGAI
jgi:hypothetical protein